MNKSEFRTIYKKKRLSLSSEITLKWSLQILDQLENLNIWQRERFHLFLPIVRLNEINTHILLDNLVEKGKSVILPKVNGENLQHIFFSPSSVIKTNHWGIPEITCGHIISEELIDVVFVPMLICDGNGNRIGYGKGFYDRFLSNCRKDCLFIGLNYFESSKESWEINPNDVPLNYCVSPNKIESFSSSQAVK